MPEYVEEEFENAKRALAGADRLRDAGGADTNQLLLDPDAALTVTGEIDRSQDSTPRDGNEISVSGTIAADRTIVVVSDDHI